MHLGVVHTYRSSSGMIAAVLVRFAYLAVSHVFAALWLLRMTDREKDVEILALRHQLAVLHRQLGERRPRLRPEDRALLAVLLVPLVRATLRRIRLLVSPASSWSPPMRGSCERGSIGARVAARGTPPDTVPTVPIALLLIFKYSLESTATSASKRVVETVTRTGLWSWDQEVERSLNLV